MLLEICCYNFQSALNAFHANADRIELCSDAAEGGVTPSVELLQEVKKNISIPVFVMIRPRGGNFYYDEKEFSQMKKSIEELKVAGADGLVFGILDAGNAVDVDRNSELVKLASPFPCTFHKAFDETADAMDALEKIIYCGFKRILTSGQKPTAMEGAELISKLIKKAENKIVIVPGGGIRSSNISELKKKTAASEFHSSGIIDEVEVSNKVEIKRMKQLISNNADGDSLSL